jgi:hypothetical protein
MSGISLNRRSGRIGAALCIALFAAACSGTSTPTNTTPTGSTGIAGNWAGTAGDITLSVTLTSNYGTLTGSGQLNNLPPMGGNPGGIVPEQVSGNFSAPNVSLTMTGSYYSVLEISGTLTDDHIVGTVSGLGPGDDSVKLNRISQ